jgi:HEAT repeat protein
LTTEETGHPKPTARQEAIGNFTVNLIQTILRTGYYSENNPEIEMVMEKVYDQFRIVIADCSEIAFMIYREPDQEDTPPQLFIEGVTEQAMTLRSGVTPGAVDLHLPKFESYCAKTDLLFIAIKSEISRKKFRMFIDALRSTEFLDENDPHERERIFNNILFEKDIHEVSTVFCKELQTRGRSLSWRVELALRRLRRDLTLLPLYEDADDEERAGIKKRIFADIARPLERPSLVAELLANIDLIVESLPDMNADQLADELVSHLTDDLVIPTTRELLSFRNKIETTWGNLSESDLEEQSSRISFLIFRIISQRMVEFGPEQTLDFYVTVVDEGHMKMEEVPEHLRPMVEEGVTACQVVQSGDNYLADVSLSSEPEVVLEKIGNVVRALERLAGSHNFSILIEAYQKIITLSPVMPEIGSALDGLLDRMLVKLAGRNMLQSLLKAFEETGKEERNQLGQLLLAIGDVALPALIELLKNSENMSVRQAIFRILTEKPETSLPLIEKLLQDRNLPWFFVRNLLLVVAEVGDPSFSTTLYQHARHQQKQVRETALGALAKIEGRRAEKALINALQDGEESVRVKALAGLTDIGCRAPEFVAFCAGLLKPEEDGKGDKAEAEKLLAVKALALQGNIIVGGKTTMEDYLLHLVKPGKKGLLRRTRKNNIESPALRAALCRALGHFGNASSQKVLEQIAVGDTDESVRQAAQKALSDIKGKTGKVTSLID